MKIYAKTMCAAVAAVALLYRYQTRRDLDDINQRVQSAKDGTNIFLGSNTNWKSVSLSPLEFSRRFSLYLQKYGAGNLPEVANMEPDQIRSVIWVLAKQDPTKLMSSFRKFAKTDELLMETIAALAEESPRSFLHSYHRFPLHSPPIAKFLQNTGHRTLQRLVHEDPGLVGVYSEELKRFNVDLSQQWKDEQFQAAVAESPGRYSALKNALKPSTGVASRAFVTSAAGTLNDDHEIYSNFEQLSKEDPKIILSGKLGIQWTIPEIMRAFISCVQKNPPDVITFYRPFTYSLTDTMRKEVVKLALAIDPSVKSKIANFLAHIRREQWISLEQGEFGSSSAEIIRAYEEALR